MKKVNYTDDAGNTHEIGVVTVTHNILLEGKVPAMVTSENKLFILVSPDMPMIDKANFELIKTKMPLELMIKVGRYFDAFDKGILQQAFDKPYANATKD